jgi:hypothetical protein
VKRGFLMRKMTRLGKLIILETTGPVKDDTHAILFATNAPVPQ